MNRLRNLIIKSRQYPYNTIVAIAAIILGYWSLFLMDYGIDHDHKIIACPFKLLTTFPCPGCGMGRATLALFGGDIYQSLYYNILCIPFTLLVIFSLTWLIYDLYRNKESFFRTIKKPISFRYKLLIFGIILITWALNIIHQI